MSRPPMNRRRSAAKTLAEEAAREVRSMPGLPAGYHLQQRTLSAYGSLEDIGESMERADETPLRTDEAETTRSKRRTPFSVSGSRPSSRESRKSSLSGSRPSSRDSRKSSVWSIDSVATLTDNGTALERRPSHFLLRRASSNASAGAASSWSRASTVTLVETPLPTAKRHPSQLRQSHLSKSHKQSSSSCIKNSFSKNDTKQPSSLKLVTTEDSESEGHPLPNAEDMAAFQNALDKVDLQVRDQVKEGYKHINIRDPRPVSREA